MAALRCKYKGYHVTFSEWYTYNGKDPKNSKFDYLRLGYTLNSHCIINIKFSDGVEYINTNVCLGYHRLF